MHPQLSDGFFLLSVLKLFIASFSTGISIGLTGDQKLRLSDPSWMAILGGLLSILTWAGLMAL